SSPAPVEELLRFVAKAARAQQLYMANNPIYRGAIEALRGAFTPIWAEGDDLSLTITENEIRWYDVVVGGESGGAKSPDNLAWLFYKDGVREITLSKGVEGDEIVKLLQIIQRARKGSADEDDLVTMLWEADFGFLKYRYVDVLQDGGGDELADGSETPAAPSPSDIQRATKEA